MSHFTVMVIGDDPEGQLAPYDENIEVAPYRDYLDEDDVRRYVEWALKPLADGEGEEYFGTPAHWDDEREQFYRLITYNPRAKWDWYEVGGRWRGYFKLKANVARHPELVGNPGVFQNEPIYDADYARKGDVDVNGMRDDAGRKAGERWDEVHELIKDLPEAEPWSTFVDRLASIEEARELYWAQPRAKALQESGTYYGSIEDFQVPREQYVQKARDHAICPYAYLKDGEWFEPGRMGWFGMSSATDDDRDTFAVRFNAMFDALDDDVMLTLVDCHI